MLRLKSVIILLKRNLLWFKLNVLGRNIQNDNQLMIIIMVLNLVTDLIELIITIIKKEGD